MQFDDLKSQPIDENTVVLPNLILHRALSISEGKSWEADSYLIDALYLSMLLEKIVLHERLLVLDHPNYDEKYYLVTGGIFRKDEENSIRARLANNPVLHKLADTNILEFVEPSFEEDSKEIQKVMYEFRTSDEIEDYLNPYIAQCILDIRLALDMDYSFIPDQSDYTISALSSLDIRNLDYSNQLLNAYEKLNKSLHNDLKRLVRAGNDKRIFLPPISAIILDRAQNFENIIDIAIEVREEFSKLRNQFREYEIKIRDDNLPIRESLEALDDLESALKLICPESETSTAISITEWRELADLTKIIDGITVNDASSLLKTSLGVPVKIAARKLKLRKVRYLSVLKENFLDIANYGDLIQNVLGRNITSEHIRQLKTSSISKGFSKYLFK